MAKKAAIEQQAETLLAPIADRHGVTIYDVEYVKEGSEFFLNCYIDKKPGGVTIDDCVDVSHDMSDRLDEAAFINDPYTLIVSSPGLGRKLTKDRHLSYSLGEEVEIKTYQAVSGSKEFSGILKGFDTDTITITTEEEDLVFPRKNIAVIKLALDF